MTLKRFKFKHTLVSVLIVTNELFFSYSQQSAEDLARVPANSTSNILNRLLLSYDPRIRPNFKGWSDISAFFYLIFGI